MGWWHFIVEANKKTQRKAGGKYKQGFFFLFPVTVSVKWQIAGNSIQKQWNWNKLLEDIYLPLTRHMALFFHYRTVHLDIIKNFHFTNGCTI